MATLNKLAQSLISAYDKATAPNHEKTVSVNPLVAEIATWYEKFRTAMDYREDEVILRSTIERILKRRTILGGDGQTVAAPLIRELVWARYFPDSTIAESQVTQVADAIDLYLKLEEEINKRNNISKGLVNEWILHLLSSEIEHILKPNDPKDIMSSFLFRIFKDLVVISDDAHETRDLQVYIAVRRAYANDDLAFLRYHLFKQYLQLNEENVKEAAEQFPRVLAQIQYQLNYPAKDNIYSYIKNQTIPFLILDDVLRKHRGSAFSVAADQDRMHAEILSACNSRYKAISGKVKRAIVRSVIFIFFTKALFALFVEGTFERVLYGRTLWSSIALNTLTPPILMIIVGVLIKTPGRDNSMKILRRVNTILYDDPPVLDKPLMIKKKPGKTGPVLWSVFIILWLATFVLSFGLIVFILTKLGINPLSQGIFMFFLAIVSFVSFRINRTANMYVIKDRKENLKSLIFDFFFMPVIQVGRRITLGISQINIFLFVFDFIIETPFKGIFAFFEQWFLFLRTQREKLD
ncbi:hypothetical protein HYS95_03630 [Candidatus Daviesbacteria bacterium]|nr:hypothetical protein [Candidatus Daviesbacteria bacterium]